MPQLARQFERVRPADPAARASCLSLSDEQAARQVVSTEQAVVLAIELGADSRDYLCIKKAMRGELGNRPSLVP